MKLSKPYKYAALAGLFILFALFGYWFSSTGLPQRYLGDKVVPVFIIIASSIGGLYVAYLTKKKEPLF
mgnify:CR=1 FL=1